MGDYWSESISGVAVAVAVVGTLWSNSRAKEARAIAREALDDTRQTRTDALWRSAVEAVNRLYSVDPIGEDGNMQAPMENQRVAFVDLVDGLEGWEGLDTWLAAEQSLGAAIGGEVIERARANPPRSTDDHLALRKPFVDWGMALSNNLRRFRKVGHDPKALTELRDNAVKHTRTIFKRNGWGLPERPTFEPL